MCAFIIEMVAGTLNLHRTTLIKKYMLLGNNNENSSMQSRLSNSVEMQI